MLKQTFDQSPTRNKILQVHRLKKHFHIGRGLTLQAVNDITFHVNQGETFELVGESGCGKSTIGSTVMGLYDKTYGAVLYNGHNVPDMSAEEIFHSRRTMQMTYPDPNALVTPRSTYKETFTYPTEVRRRT